MNLSLSASPLDLLPNKVLYLTVVALLLCHSSIAISDDNLIAHRLFQQERFAEAAEIYTDPAWKGIALYRSSQWWRAAEAFIRSDDYKSLHNLGNTYVKLGYYALALEAYQAALKVNPDFTDAAFNAELMLELISREDQQEGQSALRRKGEEIDRVESDGEEQSAGSHEDGDDNTDKSKDNGNDREGDTDSRSPSPEALAAGDSSEAGSDKTLDDDGSPEGGATRGTEAESVEQGQASTGAEGKKSSIDAQAASTRARLEAAQATQQWLNQINHDANRYLQKKIELEISRRKAAGESAPQGGNSW